jgi:hypothetical protein
LDEGIKVRKIDMKFGSWKVRSLYGAGSLKTVAKEILINSNSGDGVQLGPLGTAATDKPIVPTPGDYDDGEIGGMMIARGSRNTQRKPAPVPLCPPQTPHALPRRELGPTRWEASD